MERVTERSFKKKLMYGGDHGTHWFYMCSDIHFDSPQCDRDLLKAHFDEAVKRNATIVINGDLFDVMGMKYDPRSQKEDIRPEYQEGVYLDLVVNDCFEFLKPYVNNLGLIGLGNHETQIIKRMETNPTDRLVFLLNNFQKDNHVHMGMYDGYIILQFESGSGGRISYKIYFHHGSGGHARRSKGILSVDIDMKEQPDADLIMMGHDHNKWAIGQTVERISDQGYPYETRTETIRLGSYKKKKRGRGWETEKGFGTPTLGGYFVGFDVVKKSDKRAVNVTIEEAK